MTSKANVIAALAALSVSVGVLGYVTRGRSSERPRVTAASASSAPQARLEAPRDLLSTTPGNPAAYIPAQCYTKTKGDDGGVHNPCFVCHTTAARPNYVSDADLQLAFSFPEPARKNAWSNLFVDRRPFIAQTPDALVLSYVRASNYLAPDGSLTLARRLRALPREWDVDGDGRWSGYVPDAYFRFDERGFDRDPKGEYTGWRAFAYYPFPGTFFPTNGSMGDVLIRLPAPFRQDVASKPDQAVYERNLELVAEVLMNRAPDTGRRRGSAVKPPSFEGLAGVLQARGELRAAPGLLPAGTEFLHSVRYLDVNEGSVSMAPRLKELRYAKKVSYRTYSDLELSAQQENSEARKFPDRLRQVVGDLERGVYNGLGFQFQGFIEDQAGELRPQTLEESAFCVGCHGGIGATTDSVFSFARKLPQSAFRGGWFHPTQRGLSGLAEPKRGDGRYEYSAYLEENGAGDELRGNAEVRARFFDQQGRVKADELDALHRDVSRLLVPSASRALALDKAYWAVVKEQSFAKGRDALLAPSVNVHSETSPDEPTGVAAPVVATIR